MNKVITINLNGNAYQIDEFGYEKLKNYLATAEAKLASNPDRSEIIADFEQAIADKCQKFISLQKNVVLTAEIEQIILEMGPVEGDGVSQDSSKDPHASDASSRKSKRLYQIQDGAMLSGVCNGIAAYTDIDVKYVRIAVVILTLITNGAVALLYLGLMLFLPHATTSEEQAEAYGLNFNAQELISRASKNYQMFRDGKEMRKWRGEWRKQHAMMRRQWRETTRHWSHQGMWSDRRLYSQSVSPAVALVARPVFGILRMILVVVFFSALYSLITTNQLLGWAIPATVPLWAAIVGLVIVYKVISVPVHIAHKEVMYGVNVWAILGGIIEAFVIIAVGMWAYLNIPQVQEFIHRLPEFIGILKQYLESL